MDLPQRGVRRLPPEPVTEWIMLFPNGAPASAPKRTTDMAEVRAWAASFPETVKLHRRIVLEGNWLPHDEVVDVQLESA